VKNVRVQQSCPRITLCCVTRGEKGTEVYRLDPRTYCFS